MEVELFSPTAIAVIQGHHTVIPNCLSSQDEWKSEFKLWMVRMGWNCLMGKNVGSIKGVDYLQEEMTVNRNALTYLPIH